MSEPRTEHPAVDVHAFHQEACGAVWVADPFAVCFIGPTPFYDRYNLGPSYLLPGNVIYAANLFEPKKWVQARWPLHNTSGSLCCGLHMSFSYAVLTSSRAVRGSCGSPSAPRPQPSLYYVGGWSGEQSSIWSFGALLRPCRQGSVWR